MNTTPTSLNRELEDLSIQLRNIDECRTQKGLSDQEREALEISALALRDAERLAIAGIQKRMAEVIARECVALENYAKEIRERVKDLSKFPKTLKVISGVLTVVTQILAAVGKWR